MPKLSKPEAGKQVTEHLESVAWFAETASIYRSYAE